MEIAAGVVVQRRWMLWWPLLSAAALVNGHAAPSSQAPTASSGGETGWDDFLKQCLPTAKQLHQDSSERGQDTYLRWLAFTAASLRLSSVPRARVGRFEPLDPPVYFGPAYRGDPFFCIEWKMEPGAVLPPHCHPNVSVCTLGIEGEAGIRNYEIAGEAPEFSSTKTFRVRQTHDEVIAPGRVNTLSATRDNIHTFVAGKDGSRGIDITTYHGKDIGFSFLEIEGKPMDVERQIYEATWKKL